MLFPLFYVQHSLMLALWKECGNSLGKSAYALIHCSPAVPLKSNNSIFRGCWYRKQEETASLIQFLTKEGSNPIFNRIKYISNSLLLYIFLKTL